MKRIGVIFGGLMICLALSGCSLEYARYIEEDIEKIESEIARLESQIAQIKHLKTEIEEIHKRKAEAEEKLEKLKIDIARDRKK